MHQWRRQRRDGHRGRDSSDHTRRDAVFEPQLFDESGHAHGQVAGVGVFVALFDAGDAAVEDVDTDQQQIVGLGGQRAPLSAKVGEVFEAMGEIREARVAHRRRHALEAVGRAKDRVEAGPQGLVDGVGFAAGLADVDGALGFFDSDQLAGNASEALTGLVDEQAAVFVAVHAWRADRAEGSAPAGGEDLVDDGQHVFGLEGLDDEVGSAGLDGFHHQ